MSATTESPRVQVRPHPRWAALSRKTATFSRRLSHGLYQRLHPCARTTPVLIVGCQRSGTTMALRTFELSRHARAFHTGDAGAYEHGMLLPRDSIDRLLAESRAVVTVCKPMNQTQRVGSFREDDPNLRVVWLVRDYRDVVNSCVRKWTNMREVLGGVIESPQTAGWHGEGISPRQREVLRCHHRPIL